jgi:hypothetical protein
MRTCPQPWFIKRRARRQALDCGDGVRGVTALRGVAMPLPMSATETAAQPESGDSADAVAALQDASRHPWPFSTLQCDQSRSNPSSILSRLWLGLAMHWPRRGAKRAKLSASLRSLCSFAATEALSLAFPGNPSDEGAGRPRFDRVGLERRAWIRSAAKARKEHKACWWDCVTRFGSFAPFRGKNHVPIAKVGFDTFRGKTPVVHPTIQIQSV